MTINYVNPSQYGIWLTISSIIGWIAFFDLGLGNGFRNRFAQAKANGDNNLARQYLSTTYFAVGMIVTAVFFLIAIFNNYISWTSVLNIDASYEQELHKLFIILSAFFCLNLVANLFSTLLTADQQPGMASLLNFIGQAMSLLAIFILTETTEGSLLNLSKYFAGVPCIVMVAASIIAFRFTEYKKYSPRISDIRISLIKDIIGKGVQFFLIYICLILIFQLINIVISREIGPESVTQYNIANKYFGILYMVMNIIITPFWSAFTDAYAQGDNIWMKKTVARMERVWLAAAAVSILMLVAAPLFYKIWIHDAVVIPWELSAAMVFFVLSRSLGDIYMYMINGIGTIRIQLIAYLICAAISWPCLVYSCRLLGVYGVIVFPTAVYLLQAALGKIQLTKILNGNADGLWSK